MDFISAKLIFVILVAVVLFGYWIFDFIILYHLARFGIGTEPKKFAAIFLFGAIALFLASAMLFVNLDANSLKKQFTKLSGEVFSITNPK